MTKCQIRLNNVSYERREAYRCFATHLILMYSRLQKYPDTRENFMGKRCFRKAKKVVKFSFDLNENFCVGSLGCLEQS